MNLILLDDDDFIDDDLVCLQGRRFEHVAAILKKNEGEIIRVGRINGLMGEGVITGRSDTELFLSIQLDQPPPPPLPATLILALPRPKMLRRILSAISSMGVKSVYLINSYRVDKSYWGSPLLLQDRLEEQLKLGLEQARDTMLPKVQLRRRFKPFVEDELPELGRDMVAYVAHPTATGRCPQQFESPSILAVGPEGGFIPYEIEMLQSRGFIPINLGSRILRVETALPVLLSRYFNG